MSCNRPIRLTALVALSVFAVVPLWAQSAPAEPPDAPGKALYIRWCAGCHGDTGQGDGYAAPYMIPRPRDLTLGNFHIRSTRSGDVPTDADLHRTIADGLPGTAMTGWKTALSPQAVDTLVQYVK